MSLHFAGRVSVVKVRSRNRRKEQGCSVPPTLDRAGSWQLEAGRMEDGGWRWAAGTALACVAALLCVLCALCFCSSLRAEATCNLFFRTIEI